MSEQNKIDEIKERAKEAMIHTRDSRGFSIYDQILNDVFWLAAEIERKDEALRLIEEELTDDTSEHAQRINEIIARAAL